MRYSFIIPAFNCENTIGDTVQSIIDCCIPDIEILLIDDGSSDHTKDICKQLSSRFSNVKYYYQENRGVSFVRNKGIKLALGEYIFFVDSDDTIDPALMNQFISEVEKKQQINIAVFGMTFDYYYKGSKYRSDKMMPPYNGVVDKTVWSKTLEELYRTNSLNSLCNKMFRREFLTENHLLLNNDLFLYEDFEYFIRCLSLVKDIFFSQKCIYHYRQADDQGNAGRRLKRINHLNEFINELEESWNTLENSMDTNLIPIVDLSKNKVLISLYTTLAREKAEVSNLQEIKKICLEYSAWMQGHDKIEFSNNKFAAWFVRKKVLTIYTYIRYIKVRHGIAVIVKSTIRKIRHV